MKRYIFISVLLFTAGAGAGFFGGISTTRETATTPPAVQRPVPTQTTPVTGSEEVSKPAGEGMTPVEMSTYLEELPADVTFDMTYMNYLIKLRSTESGITRLARDKATNPELKAFARELYDADQQYITELYTKQRNWGFTHN